MGKSLRTNSILKMDYLVVRARDTMKEGERNVTDSTV